MTDEVWLRDVVREALRDGHEVSIELGEPDSWHICVDGERVTGDGHGLTWESLNYDISGVFDGGRDD